MSVTFTWLGHSAFLFDIDGHKLLVDPFLTDNPLAAMKADEVEAEAILVSHAHGDHVGDTVAIAKRTGAVVVCNFEMGNWFLSKGVENVVQGNPGGTYDGGFFKAKWTIAHHSSSFPDGTYGGQPNGFIITAGGKKLYFAGDTALFMDMQQIGAVRLDVAFLPIGDLFTMGIDDSIQATKWLNPQHVVPMHFNTWPPITQDVVTWADRIHRETSASPVVFDPGGSFTL